jgi:predicted phosphodiesterase
MESLLLKTGQYELPIHLERVILMRTNSVVRWGAMVLFCLVTVAGYGQSDFTSDVKSAPYPWTHTRFLETNKNFHFAVVSDREGGCRQGVFEDAVEKLNLLRPSFVMSIGDFVEGYTDNVDRLKAQWTEFDNIVKYLAPPFFYVVGNHDYCGTLLQKRFWQTLHGPTYYYFVYNNTLFICLNSFGDSNHEYGLGEKQLAWAKDILAKNQNVRWTFIFMHAPLWTESSDFGEFEKQLKGHNYTVFAGHIHQYTYYSRQGMKYFVLATTGGGFDKGVSRGKSYGEFDHVMWVSMTDSGPKFANLELCGILPEDLCTEASLKLWKSTRFESKTSSINTNGTDFTFSFKNEFDMPMKFMSTWKDDSLWSIQPKIISETVQPGKAYSQVFHAEFNGNNWVPLPKLACQYTAGTFNGSNDLTPSLDCFSSIWSKNSIITAKYTRRIPKIDGKLDDPLWKRPSTVNNLMYPDLSGWAVPQTQVWIAYDEKNLYVAWQCEEKDMKNLIARQTERDSYVWNDDCLELFLDPSKDHKIYYQFDINPLGTIYDGTGFGDRTFNANVQVAALRGDDCWTVELAVPWKDLKVQPSVAGTTIRYELSRLRQRNNKEQAVMQFPPLGKAFNHQPELFGTLILGQ